MTGIDNRILLAAVYLFLLIFLETIADIFAKEYSLKGNLIRAGVSLSFYLVANACWLVSLRYKSNLAVGANIFCVAQGVAALMIGVWMYGEVLSIQQYVGVAIGIIALILLVF